MICLHWGGGGGMSLVLNPPIVTSDGISFPISFPALLRLFYKVVRAVSSFDDERFRILGSNFSVFGLPPESMLC